MEKDIEKAIEVLYNGGLILYPTDTVWGIGCDATKPEAVQKIYDLKKRTDAKSMLILVSNLNRINSYSDSVPDVALDIIEMANKPTTIIFDDAKNLAQNLINKDGSIGIRVPDDKFCQLLLRRFKRPVVSTSANITGEKNALNFNAISKAIKEGVDYVVKFKQEQAVSSKPSSIIKIAGNGEISIIRK